MKLHIINNEKITQRTISVFEKVFPHDNKFIILDTVMDRFDTSVYNSEIVFVGPRNKKGFWDAVGDLAVYQHVIIHFLSYEVINLFGNATHPSIFWIEWGADLYINLLHPRGYKLYENPDYAMKMLMPNLPLCVVKTLYQLRRRQYQRKYQNFVQKVKYFVPDSMPGEYELLLSYYPEFSHLIYRNFFYYPVDLIIKDRNLISKGSNIMINHCATLTGNHMELLNILSEFNLNHKKIVIPVSYGNSNHALNVEEYANYLFGNNAIICKNYLPLDKYNELLESCDVFIYGHYRQEAVGNILIAFYLGGKVYLHKDNPLFGFYKGIGLSVFSIEEDLSEVSVNEKLDAFSIKKNKQIIDEYYSESKLYSLVEESFR